MLLFSTLTIFILFACCANLSQEFSISPKKVGAKTIRYFDKTRDRPLETEIFYPVEDTVPSKQVANIWQRCEEARDAPIKASSTKYPLLIMSHGDLGSRLDSTWILEILADNGYIVAAVDHYGNTWYDNKPSTSMKRWDRPQDISYVISELLADPEFGGKIDSSKIGFLGFSLGGLTGVWIAGGIANLYAKPTLSSLPHEINPAIDQHTLDSIDYSTAKKSYHDPRVKAAVLLAPAYGKSFDDQGLQEIKIPILIIAGAEDEVVNVDKNAKRYSEAIKGVKSKILQGKVGHYVFLNIPTEMGSKFIKPKYIKDDPSINRKSLHDEIAIDILNFFNETLKGDK